ncbi:MAG: PepSY domain-containing protein [Gemmataceae bacterium]
MKMVGNILFGLVFALVIAGLIVGLSARNHLDHHSPATTENPSPTSRSQLPLEPLRTSDHPRQIATAASEENRSLGTSISLIQAIVIAEKISGGVAFKVECKDKPVTSFKIEFRHHDGQRGKIELAGDGRVLNIDGKHLVDPPNAAPSSSQKD